MERLTKKRKDYHFNTLNDLWDYFGPIEEKLKKLEDIEEELGMDLIVFMRFILLHHGSVSYKEGTNIYPFSTVIGVEIKLHDAGTEIVDMATGKYPRELYLITLNGNKCTKLSMHDFNKTWVVGSPEKLEKAK